MRGRSLEQSLERGSEPHVPLARTSEFIRADRPSSQPGPTWRQPLSAACTSLCLLLSGCVGMPHGDWNDGPQMPGARSSTPASGAPADLGQPAVSNVAPSGSPSNNSIPRSTAPQNLGIPDEPYRQQVGRPAGAVPPANSLSQPSTPPVGSSSTPALQGPQLQMPEARRRGVESTAVLEAPVPKTTGRTPRKGLLTQLISNETELPSEPAEYTPWTRYYRSTERRSIETWMFGTGPRKVMILSSLHGDQVQSAALVQALAAHLARHPEQLQGLTVLIVKSPNPDGESARSAYNSRGVDLNRNFPTANWQSLPNQRAGSKANSEAETRVLVRVLLDFQPQLVVHVKDSRQGAFVNVDGPARPLANQIAQTTQAQLLENLGAATSGSIEAYATTKLDAASLTLLLPDLGMASAAWERYHPGLMLCLHPGSTQKSATPGPTTPQQSTPAQNVSSDRTSTGSTKPRGDQSGSLPQQPSPRTRPSQPRNGVGKPTSPITEDELDEFPIDSSPQKAAGLPVPETGYLELPPSP